MGLGAFPKVSLAKARELRDDARKLVAAGIDPIIARGGAQQAAASALSVKQACERYLEAQKAKWRTAGHIKQMRQRLRDYVHPILGHMPIADIKMAEAKQVLAPIWTVKNPTASRVRQYLEDVINWAEHEGLRSEDMPNPFEEKRIKWAFPLGIHKVKSHPALSFEAAPSFLTELRAIEGVKAKALEFVMLTATRIGDLVGGGKQHSVPMLWSHIDPVEKTWRIPDTKKSRPHTVPLSDAALRVLDTMRAYRKPGSDIVFPGSNGADVLSSATLRHMLKAMGYGGKMSTHGARSMFRTWAAERTHASKDIIEMSLAHAQSALDEAYMRGELLNKRRQLMSAWADYLEGAKVLALADGRRAARRRLPGTSAG